MRVESKSTPHFASLPEQGKVKYLITSCCAYSRTLVLCATTGLKNKTINRLNLHNYAYNRFRFPNELAVLASSLVLEEAKLEDSLAVVEDINN